MASVPPTGDLRCPALVVGARRLDAVPAVDEEERQRRLPVRATIGDTADDADHGPFEVGLVHRAQEHRQRVQPAGRRVDERRVVVLPPGLVLLGAAVVVDGEERPCGGRPRACGAEYTADLPQYVPTSSIGRPGRAPSGVDCGVVQRKPSSTGMKPFAASAIARSRASTSVGFGGGVRLEQHPSRMTNFATQSTPNPARFAKLTTTVESDHVRRTPRRPWTG